MPVGEQHLPGPQVAVLGGDRLLDLEQQVGAGPDRRGVRRQLGAALVVVGVTDARAVAGAGLYQDLVAGGGELARAGRC
jgi:hypothetical protein